MSQPCPPSPWSHDSVCRQLCGNCRPRACVNRAVPLITASCRQLLHFAISRHSILGNFPPIALHFSLIIPPKRSAPPFWSYVYGAEGLTRINFSTFSQVFTAGLTL